MHRFTYKQAQTHRHIYIYIYIYIRLTVYKIKMTTFSTGYALSF